MALAQQLEIKKILNYTAYLTNLKAFELSNRLDHVCVVYLLLVDLIVETMKLTPKQNSSIESFCCLWIPDIIELTSQ